MAEKRANTKTDKATTSAKADGSKKKKIGQEFNLEQNWPIINANTKTDKSTKQIQYWVRVRFKNEIGREKGKHKNG